MNLVSGKLTVELMDQIVDDFAKIYDDVVKDFKIVLEKKKKNNQQE